MNTTNFEPQTAYSKRILTASETANYMGIALSSLYKLTHNRAIPHSKPCGKLLFFDREEIERWLMSNKVRTQAELEAEAISYSHRKGGAR